MKTLRVLIVEDYRDTAELVALWITSAGHAACICETGFQAEQVAPVLRPDVVLLDIGLPDMNGWELAPVLRREMPLVKIFAATACQSFDDRQKSKDAGIDLHLGKPLHKDKLLRLLALVAADQPLD